MPISQAFEDRFDSEPQAPDQPSETVLLKEYEQAINISKENGLAIRQNAAMFIALCSAISIAIATKEIDRLIAIILLMVIACTGLLLSNSIYRNNARNRSYMNRAREIEAILGMRLMVNGNNATEKLHLNISNRRLIISVVTVGSVLSIAFGILFYFFGYHLRTT